MTEYWPVLTDLVWIRSGRRRGAEVWRLVSGWYLVMWWDDSSTRKQRTEINDRRRALRLARRKARRWRSVRIPR